MPTAQIKFYVLDVGQGACNYVEVISDANVVTHNLLVDLGTNSSQAIATNNLQWLRDKIIAQGRHLNVLVITHGDTDHYNMIAKILPAFGPAAGNQIDMVRYGGPDWRYGGGLIATLTQYTPNIGSFTETQTGYDEDTDPVWTPIWEAAAAATEPKLQLIVANTPHPKDGGRIGRPQRKMNAEAVNTKSVVTALQWANRWFVATGDATATTLSVINDLLLLAPYEDFPPTVMMTTPHHGSRKTTYDLKVASDIPDFDARLVVSEFLDILPPMTLSISAGEKRHHHPSLYLIQQFSAELPVANPYWSDPLLNNQTHFLTSWIDKAITPIFLEPGWPARWQYATTTTRTNVYCTLYCKTAQYNDADYNQYVCPPVPVRAEPAEHEDVLDAPLGRNWEFRIDATGTLRVDSTANEARAEAERADLAIAFKPPPPGFTTAAGRAARLNLTAPGAVGAAAWGPPRTDGRAAHVAQHAASRLASLRAIA